MSQHIPERLPETCPRCKGWVWHRTLPCGCKPGPTTNKPTKPGFYWARWLTPVPNTFEAGEWSFPMEWAVVEVWENFIGEPCEADAAEKWGVSVPGVREMQWVENFEWGGVVRKEQGNG
jgi:hypothetical protein